VNEPRGGGGVKVNLGSGGFGISLGAEGEVRLAPVDVHYDPTHNGKRDHKRVPMEDEEL